MHSVKGEVKNELSNRPGMDSELRRFCGGDNILYGAMSHFLLLDPKSQERQIGTISNLWEEGAKDLEKGNTLQAKAAFETAGRLSLYHEDKASLVKSLELAEKASGGANAQLREWRRILLSKIDTSLGIASQYYEEVYPKSVAAENEAKTLEVAPEISWRK